MIRRSLPITIDATGDSARADGEVPSSAGAWSARSKATDRWFGRHRATGRGGDHQPRHAPDAEIRPARMTLCRSDESKK